jgi:hypothetical protein
MNRRSLVATVTLAIVLIALLDFGASLQLIGSILFTAVLAPCALQDSKKASLRNGGEHPLRDGCGRIVGFQYRDSAAPRIFISAEKSAEDVWIFSVRDHGLEIDVPYFDRIFVLFQRLHGREERVGDGMGLAIGQKIVERFGGRSWVVADSYCKVKRD